jgi:5-amino-6-(5-phosphoribosylamino)uracil reductase/diaminohydroxyphosphoribosylaminopyrimidine deaminase/5-amino-6-(5-phosphoribosylamino)uracil reductase
VLADDPLLTVRLVPGPSPLRVVVDARLRIPEHAQVLTDRTAPTLIACTESAPIERRKRLVASGLEVICLPPGQDGGVSFEELVGRLGERGVDSVLIEGGRRVITSALAARAVDRVVICIAPKILGEGIAAVGDLGVDELTRALTFRRHRFNPLEGDIIFDGELETPSPPA